MINKFMVEAVRC